MIVKVYRTAQGIIKGLFTRPSMFARITISLLPSSPDPPVAEVPTEAAWLCILLLPDNPSEGK